MMRIVCFGSGSFGVPTFDALSAEHDIALVVSQPDRPAGRSRAPTPTPVADWASSQRLPALKPARVSDPAVVRAIRDTPADAWVVIAFGQKLPPELLADRFAVNLHASLLPRWRGAAPIPRAILAGDRRTGASVIALADRMDAGDVFAASPHAIDPETTAGDLHDALSRAGAPLMARVLRDFATGNLTPTPQDESLATLAPKISRHECWLDFAQAADLCRRRVHAFSPTPGVRVRLEGAGAKPVELKLRRVQALDASDEQQRVSSSLGNVVDAKEGVVACTGGALRLLEVQPAGRSPMPWPDFARGWRPPREPQARSLVPPPRLQSAPRASSEPSSC